jgi:DNA-binding transcriptional LysR family regulator
MVNFVSISQALVVADHLSFSRAAKALGVRQSAVSRRIRSLEDELGVSLFERATSGVRLTEAGRRFLNRSRTALDEIDHAVKAAASAGRGAEGTIRIGIQSSLSDGFPRELLRVFRQTHPAVCVHIVEGSAREQLTRISEHALDIALVSGGPPAPHCDMIVLCEAPVVAV